LFVLRALCDWLKELTATKSWLYLAEMNVAFLLVLALPLAIAADGNRTLADYFRAETRVLAEQCLADVQSLDDWTGRRGPDGATRG
jgi:hypothetical protein